MEFYDFHFIWDVIRNPLTNSIIFQDGYCTTNQSLSQFLYLCIFMYIHVYIWHHVIVYLQSGHKIAKLGAHNSNNHGLWYINQFF